MAQAGRPLERSSQTFLTKADVAYEWTKQAIQSHALAAGDRLAAAEVAAALGMSPVPVREALSRLAAEGLVRMDAHRGFFVPEMTAADLLDIYETLAVLEPLAAHLAFPNLTKSDLDRAGELLQELLELESTPATWIARNLDFHLTLYAPSRRPRLLRTISQLTTEAMRELQKHEAYLNFLNRSDREHREMVALLREGHIDEMADLLVRHIQQTCNELVVQKRREGGDGQVALVSATPKSRDDFVPQAGLKERTTK